MLRRSGVQRLVGQHVSQLLCTRAAGLRRPLHLLHHHQCRCHFPLWNRWGEKSLNVSPDNNSWQVRWPAFSLVLGLILKWVCGKKLILSTWFREDHTHKHHICVPCRGILRCCWGPEGSPFHALLLPVAHVKPDQCQSQMSAALLLSAGAAGPVWGCEAPSTQVDSSLKEYLRWMTLYLKGISALLWWWWGLFRVRWMGSFLPRWEILFHMSTYTRQSARTDGASSADVSSASIQAARTHFSFSAALYASARTPDRSRNTILWLVKQLRRQFCFSYLITSHYPSSDMTPSPPVNKQLAVNQNSIESFCRKGKFWWLAPDSQRGDWPCGVWK